MKLLPFLLTLSLSFSRESTDSSSLSDKCSRPELWAWTTAEVSKEQVCLPDEFYQEAIDETTQGESTRSVPISSDLTIPINQTKNEALEAAIRRGDKEKVSHLLPDITDLNRKNQWGWGPLHIAAHYAAYDESFKIVKMLIEKGFDPNTLGAHGWIALHIAASENAFEILRFLIESGARVDKVAADGLTALHMAAMKNSYSVIQPLIEAGSNLHAYTEDGYSPLELAIRLNALEVVQLLIRTEAYQSKTSTWIKLKLLGAALYSKHFKMAPLLFTPLPPKKFTVQASLNHD